MAGIAITDHECLGSHVKANQYAKKLRETNPDFTVALGNEIYLTDTREQKQKYYHFILIAKDRMGYEQLSRLSTLAWLNSYFDRGMERVPTLKSELAAVIGEDKGHLIAQSACLGGELSTETMNLINAEKCGDRIAAEKAHNNIVQFMFFCLDLFGDDFYVEVAPGLSKEQIAVNKRLKSIADAFGCKMSIGCDAHFMRQEDKYVHNAFLNSKGGERETDAFYKYAHLYSVQEAEKNLLNCFDKDFIQEIFQNSLEIKNKIEFFDLFHKQSVVEVPVKNYDKKSMERKDEYPILESLFTSDNEQERYWINQCWEGLQKKFNCSPYDKPVYLKRLEEEATTKKIIGEKLETNLFAYPITLQHYIDLIWKCGSIVACGRGSGCAGLNHWLLGVTQANPIRWEFPWFRYLNEERIELPKLILGSCKTWSVNLARGCRIIRLTVSEK